MSREELIVSADSLKPVSPESIDEYIEKSELLSYKINDFMLKQPDINQLIGGSNNITVMKDNHKNHLIFIASILSNPNNKTLVDSVIWVFRSYMSRGFKREYWDLQLRAWNGILKENLSEKAYNDINNIYEWLRSNIKFFDSAASRKD